jgi:hypothetical protein
MTTAQRIAQRIDDGVNPIVVKELRQAIGGKFLPAVLMLFLLVQLFAMAMAVWMARIDDDFIAGRGVFIVLETVLMATCLLFLPAYAGLRLSAERNENNTDLLYITTIRPRSIVWGKFLAAMVLAVLLFSACTPFLALTFLLRGIDLPTIFFLLSINFVTVAVGVMFAIFMACIPAKRSTRFVLGLVTLGAMVGVFSSAFGFSMAATTFGFGPSMGTWEFWAGFATSIGFVVLGMGLAIVLSVAMISPPSSNRALYVRLYLLGLWLISAAAAAAWTYYWKDLEVMIVWVGGTLCLLGLVMLGSISERDDLGPRVRRAVPRFAPLRIPAFLFFSGSAGGVAWTLLMTGATFAVAHYAHKWAIDQSLPSAKYMPEFLDVAGVLTLYALAYLLTALFLRRTILSWLIIPVNTYALALILMALGSIIPFLIMLLATDARFNREMPWLMITVPFTVLGNEKTTNQWWFVSIWAAVIGAITLPWILMRWYAFCRISPSTPQKQEGLTTETQRHREEKEHEMVS